MPASKPITKTGRRSRTRNRPKPPRILPVPVNTAMEQLRAVYGSFEWEPRLGALDELIFTVLTQHTSDLNAERAYNSLRDRMPEWTDVIEADPREVPAAIQQGGLANQKSVRIQQILREVIERRGRLDLNFLSELPLEDAKQWLRSLPGVGPKTAAVVLAFSLGSKIWHKRNVATR